MDKMYKIYTFLRYMYVYRIKIKSHLNKYYHG